jgi:phospholipid/cholesterol/gamma-HCH transport system ATP-binding protein
MGGSGCGKTTVLRLIGGLDGQEIDTRRRATAVRAAPPMGMLFQFGALFTDLSVFENVAFPLREHMDLSESDDPRHRADEAQRGGPARRRALRISEVSGGMARRVALARAIALDPEVIMYDEPFAGLDPISMGVTANLIRALNDTTGATSMMVSHDVQESSRSPTTPISLPTAASRRRHARRVARLDRSNVRQFIDGAPDGPFKFHYPSNTPLAADFGIGGGQA